jgi:UDPglucose 6-dehydrogenase
MPGLGYGGSCFPKDIAAFIIISEQLGVPFNLLKEVQRINDGTKRSAFLKSCEDALCGLGGTRKNRVAGDLTFKPAPMTSVFVAIELVADILREGAR